MIANVRIQTRFKVGDRVKHPKIGIGVVNQIDFAGSLYAVAAPQIEEPTYLLNINGLLVRLKESEIEEAD